MAHLWGYVVMGAVFTLWIEGIQSQGCIQMYYAEPSYSRARGLRAPGSVDKATCEGYCNERSWCKGYQLQASTQTCWIFNGYGSRSFNPCCTYYRKGCAPVPPPVTPAPTPAPAPGVGSVPSFSGLLAFFKNKAKTVAQQSSGGATVVRPETCYEAAAEGGDESSGEGEESAGPTAPEGASLATCVGTCAAVQVIDSAGASTVTYSCSDSTSVSGTSCTYSTDSTTGAITTNCQCSWTRCTAISPSNLNCLKFYLPLDGDAYDLSGSKRNGNPHKITWDSSVSKLGSSAYFAGDSYIKVNALRNVALNPFNSTTNQLKPPFSLVMWFKSALPDGTEGVLLSNDVIEAKTLVQGSTQTITFSATLTDGQTYTASSTAPASQWVILAAVVTDTGNLELYVTEAAIDAGTASATTPGVTLPLATSSKPLYLGASTAKDRLFMGHIDEVYLFCSTLSQTDLKSIRDLTVAVTS